jgi:hypothetical protein
MDLKSLEPMFIEMSSQMTAEFDREGATPEERIEAYNTMIEEVRKDVGDSLLGRMLTTMFQWHIDQIKLEIRVFN